MEKARAVIAKLSALALAAAAVLAGHSAEKRSYALVNDSWSLLILTLVALSSSAAGSAASRQSLAGSTGHDGNAPPTTLASGHCEMLSSALLRRVDVQAGAKQRCYKHS